MRDVRERYSHVKDYIKVILIESGVHLVRGVVKEVLPKTILLRDGANVPYGLLVWSTGVGPSRFTKTLGLPKAPGGRIGIDMWLRVPSVEDVFALGDCASFLEQTGKQALPALAQVAEREGKYLAGWFTSTLEAWLLWDVIKHLLICARARMRKDCPMPGLLAGSYGALHT